MAVLTEQILRRRLEAACRKGGIKGIDIFVAERNGEGMLVVLMDMETGYMIGHAGNGTHNINHRLSEFIYGFKTKRLDSEGTIPKLVDPYSMLPVDKKDKA